MKDLQKRPKYESPTVMAPGELAGGVGFLFSFNRYRWSLPARHKPAGVFFCTALSLNETASA